MARILALLMLLLAAPVAADPKADEADVRLIIGGHFAEDHIGPKTYTDVKQRALARPIVYLGILERFALASTPQSLSSTFIPYAIEWIGAKARPEAKALATKLLPVYRKARATKDPKADTYRDQRLDDRIAELARLAR